MSKKLLFDLFSLSYSAKNVEFFNQIAQSIKLETNADFLRSYFSSKKVKIPLKTFFASFSIRVWTLVLYLTKYPNHGVL